MYNKETISFVLLISLFFGIFSAFTAKKYNRNPYFWFAIGFSFGVWGILALFFLKRKPVIEKPICKPITPKDNHLWYYLDEADETKGPHSANKLISLFLEKKINNQTYVWNESFEQWTKLEKTEIGQILTNLSN